MLKSKIHPSDRKVVRECGEITVTNNVLSARAQTYTVNCPEETRGNRVRVRLENTGNPLEIAEISVMGYIPFSEFN